MKTNSEVLKIFGIACTLLGASISVLSDIIGKEQTKLEISKQVEEQIKIYMDRRK